MSWKCPVCGNSENLDESLRCVCDQDIQSDDIEKYEVEPGVIEVYSQKTKLGEGTREFNTKIRLLQVLSLVVIAAFEFFAQEPIASIATCLGLTIFMLIVIAETIVKRQVSTRYYVIKKAEVPSAYNYFLFMFAVMAISFFGKSVYELLK